MSFVIIFLLIALGVSIMVANVLASRRILHDEFSTKNQKVAQLLIVWLVPIVGAALVFILTSKSLDPVRGKYTSEREDVAVSRMDYDD